MNQLTNRELEVLKHLSKGYSLDQVAKAMFLSLETVRSHKKSVYNKLNINTGIQLGMWIANNLKASNLKIA